MLKVVTRLARFTEAWARKVHQPDRRGPGNGAVHDGCLGR